MSIACFWDDKRSHGQIALKQGKPIWAIQNVPLVVQVVYPYHTILSGAFEDDVILQLLQHVVWPCTQHFYLALANMLPDKLKRGLKWAWLGHMMLEIH